MPKSLRQHTHHLDKRLRFRLRLYFLIAVILIGILISDIVRGLLRIDYGLLGLALGIFIGVITSRMFHTSWDKDAQKVVSRLDIFGTVIIVIYIVFAVFRARIIGYFTHNVDVGTVGLALVAGIMFGRVLGTRGKIIKVLKEQKVFH